MKKLKEHFNYLGPLTKYLIYSVFVTLLDVSIVWILVRLFKMDLVIANSTGVIAGFMIHYLLASKSVFDAEFGVAGFVIYLATFVLGLFLANWLIVFCNDRIFHTFDENRRLLMSKGVSIVLPFFILYGIRKAAYSALERCRK